MPDKKTPAPDPKPTEVVADTPTVKVEVTTEPAHPTPEQDAKNAFAARQAAEDAAQARHQKLEDDGLLVTPAPLTGYEFERAKVGQPAE